MAGTQRMQPVLTTADADGVGIRLFLSGKTRAAALIIGTDAVLSPFAVPDNEWSHVVWTFNENTKRITVTVNAKEEVDKAFGQYHGTAVSWLGKLVTSAGNVYFTGSMDELVFFDRALNLFEIEVLAGVVPAVSPITNLQFEDSAHL